MTKVKVKPTLIIIYMRIRGLFSLLIDDFNKQDMFSAFFLLNIFKELKKNKCFLESMYF